MTNKISVLFVCTGNSARSQIAEALLRHAGGEYFEVASAGTNPKPINPKALEVLQTAGISTEGLYSKDLATFSKHKFDLVISLCDKAAQECRFLPNSQEAIAWSFEDPATNNDPETYEHLLRAISERINLLVMVKTKGH